MLGEADPAVDRRTGSLPRGRYRYAFVPPRPGRYMKTMACVGPGAMA